MRKYGVFMVLSPLETYGNLLISGINSIACEYGALSPWLFVLVPD